MAIQIQRRTPTYVITCNHKGERNSQGLIVPLNIVLTFEPNLSPFITETLDILDSFCDNFGIVPALMKYEVEQASNGGSRFIFE